MKMLKVFGFFIVAALVLSSCTTMTSTMKTPSNIVEFDKSDFEFSEQVSGEASQVLILGIDWARLFTKKMGTITEPVLGFSIPIIGSMVQGRINNFAIYNIISDHPGYDVVFYPTFETKVVRPIGVPLIYVKKNVKVTARLAKIKK